MQGRISIRWRRFNPRARTVALSYGNRDNLTGMPDPKGQAITRTDDALERLTQIATPDKRIYLTYDAADRLTVIAAIRDGIPRLVQLPPVLGVLFDKPPLAVNNDSLTNAPA